MSWPIANTVVDLARGRPTSETVEGRVVRLKEGDGKWASSGGGWGGGRWRRSRATRAPLILILAPHELRVLRSSKQLITASPQKSHAHFVKVVILASCCVDVLDFGLVTRIQTAISRPTKWIVDDNDKTSTQSMHTQQESCASRFQSLQIL